MSRPSANLVRASLRQRREELAERQRVLRQIRADDPSRDFEILETKQLRWGGASIVGVVAFVVGCSLDAPRLLVLPGNVLTFTLSFLGGALCGVPGFLPATVLGLFFALVYRRRRRASDAFLVFAAILVFLSMRWSFVQWSEQVALLTMSAAWWSLIAALGLMARSGDSVWLDWTFQVVFFVWLAWYAFPLLGIVDGC